jgi:Cupin-like domain
MVACVSNGRLRFLGCFGLSRMTEYPAPFKIRRITPPEPQAFYSDFVAKNTPVIVRGLLDSWPALIKWTPDYLKATFGQFVVSPEVSETGKFSSYDLDRSKEMSFAEFMDIISSPLGSNTLCITNHSLPSTSKAGFIATLMADIEVPPYVTIPRWYSRRRYKRLAFWRAARPSWQPSVNLFIGGGGNVTTLHYDSGQDALLAVVRGSKKVVLFDPSQGRCLYPSSPRQSRWLFNSSPIDVREPDLDRYPLFRRATASECSLEEGDVLYLPSCWWHYIESFGFNVALNMPFGLSVPRLFSRYGRDRYVHIAYNRLASTFGRARKYLRSATGTASNGPDAGGRPS